MEDRPLALLTPITEKLRAAFGRLLERLRPEGPCPRCHGTGVWRSRDCPDCGGKGKR